MHTRFEDAFTNGFTTVRLGETLRVDVVSGGTLVVRAGEALYAADPAVENSVKKLVEAMLPGEYHVELSRLTVVGESTAAGEGVVCAARAVLAPGAVVAWEDVATVGVDTGRIVFATDTFLEEECEPMLESGDLFEALPNGAAVAMRSGFGDGGYACFAGKGADGRVLQVAVDFLVLVEPRTVAVRLPWTADAPTGPFDAPELREAGVSLSYDGVVDGAPTFGVDARRRKNDDATDFVVYLEERAPRRGTQERHSAVKTTSQGERYTFAFDAVALDAERVILTFQAGLEPAQSRPDRSAAEGETRTD